MNHFYWSLYMSRSGCNEVTNQKRPYYSNMNVHSHLSLHRWHWDAIKWDCILCCHHIYSEQKSQLLFGIWTFAHENFLKDSKYFQQWVSKAQIKFWCQGFNLGQGIIESDPYFGRLSKVLVCGVQLKETGQWQCKN